MGHPGGAPLSIIRLSPLQQGSGIPFGHPAGGIGDFVGGSRARVRDEPAAYENGSLLAGEWFASIEALEEKNPLNHECQ